MTSTMLSVAFMAAIASGAAAQQRTQSDWTEQAFRDLDRNNDGRVTTDEWSFDREAFRRADHNGDGVVTRREFLGGDDPNSNNTNDALDDTVEARRFDLLDTDRDNRVSRREWRESRAEFDALDENRDGVLTRAELASQDGGTYEAGPFADLDSDRSGAISRGEWPESAASFNRLDTNRDGRLSRAEYNRGRRGGVGRDGRDASDANDRATPAWRAGYARGLAEGRVAGREDRQRGQWDLDGQRELEQADSGYDRSIGSRADYQAGYRAAFRIAYREGFGPRS